MSLYYGLSDSKGNTKDYEHFSDYYKSESARKVFHFCSFEGKSSPIDERIADDITVFRPSDRILFWASQLFKDNDIAMSYIMALAANPDCYLWVCP